MENGMKPDLYRAAFFVMILTGICGLAFTAGLVWSRSAHAADGPAAKKNDRKVKVVYPKKTDLDFEGLDIQGEVRNPGEFYFASRPQEKFDSLVKRRPNFHRELLRDAVLSK